MSGFQQARIELGIRLRRLRENAHLSGKELAERLHWQPSKVSRLENARQTATEGDVRAWGRAVQADQETVDLLIDRLSALLEQRDRHRHHGLGGLQEEAWELESRVRLLRAFEPSAVIGLVQTA